MQAVINARRCMALPAPLPAASPLAPCWPVTAAAGADTRRLTTLPLYGMGVSSGAAFVLKIARFFQVGRLAWGGLVGRGGLERCLAACASSSPAITNPSRPPPTHPTHPHLPQMDGIMSEALGIEESVWGLKQVEGPYPPTVFVSMERDAVQRAKIAAAYAVLKKRGSPVAVVKVGAGHSRGGAMPGVAAGAAHLQAASWAWEPAGARGGGLPRSRARCRLPWLPLLQSYPRKVYTSYFSDRHPLGINEGERFFFSFFQAPRCMPAQKGDLRAVVAGRAGWCWGALPVPPTAPNRTARQARR